MKKVKINLFENPDGSALILDMDYLGKKRLTSEPTAGPFENIDTGAVRLKVR